MEDQNVAFRLKGFIDSQGLSSSQFADLCGIPRPSLSQLLTGRNKKISDVLVGQIHKAFPDLSVLWLLFGEGEMLRSQKASEDIPDSNGSVGADALVDSPVSFVKLADNLFSSADRADASVESNLRPLGDGEKYKKIIDNLRVESERRIAELQAQIDQMRSSPRKVAQITVYYDDSTFETFYSK